MTIPDKERQFLITYNIEKAETAINDAQFLIDNNKVYTGYNRIYYACFYILTALSLKNNFSTSKHKQLIGWFNKNFVNKNILDKKYGRFLNRAYEQRAESDYGVLINPSSKEAQSLLDEAKEFVTAIKNII